MVCSGSVMNGLTLVIVWFGPVSCGKRLGMVRYGANGFGSKQFGSVVYTQLVRSVLVTNSHKKQLIPLS
jgi:hypothetical protein